MNISTAILTIISRTVNGVIIENSFLDVGTKVCNNVKAFVTAPSILVNALVE